jgi:hypothetical protein
MGIWGLRPSQYNFMVIKYSDKFESIFYAVLCANITGYFLVPKTQPPGLFEEEEFIDIDRTNWQQIISEHNRKFGDIKWFNNSSQFLNFKENINLALRFWQPFKYRIVIEAIKIAIKYGLSYLDNDDLAENKYWQSIIKQIKNEILLASGNINFIPANKNQDKFLLGEFNEESRIGDLVLKNLQQKYFGYNLILRTSKFVYMSYGEKIWVWDIKKFEANLSLAKILELIYCQAIKKPLKDKSAKDMTIGLDFLPSQSLAFG